jgi:hypothetical protein
MVGYVWLLQRCLLVFQTHPSCCSSARGPLVVGGSALLTCAHSHMSHAAGWQSTASPLQLGPTTGMECNSTLQQGKLPLKSALMVAMDCRAWQR